MKQIISKDGVVKCTTTVPYPQAMLRDLRRAGYKIKTVEDDAEKVGSKK